MKRDRSVELREAAAPPFFYATHGATGRGKHVLPRMGTAILAALLWLGGRPVTAQPVDILGRAISAFETRDLHHSADAGQAGPGPGAPLAGPTRDGGAPPPLARVRPGREQPRPSGWLHSPAADASAQSTNCLILGILYDMHARRAGLYALGGATPPPLRVPVG